MLVPLITLMMLTARWNLFSQYRAYPRFLLGETIAELGVNDRNGEKIELSEETSIQAAALSNLSCCIRSTLEPVLVMPTSPAALTFF